jgi:N-carbamoylputrescine amidase
MMLALVLRVVDQPALFSSLRIAAVAGSFGPGIDDAIRAVEDARDAGARLVVLPEGALGGHPGPPLLLDGPEIARLGEAAGSTVVLAGFTELAPHGITSSAVAVHGDGILGHHRKVHVPPAERDWCSPGDGFAAFDTPVGRIGMLLCYDKVFPEAARALALDGAELIACMAAWPACRFDPAPNIDDDRQVRQFDVLDQARAIENQVVWVSSNVTGSVDGLTFLGHAKVVDPDGEVLATTDHHAGMAIAEVHVQGSVLAARLRYTHLEDRMPLAYGPTELETPDLQIVDPA